jgi:hypothetical protein
MSSVGKGTKEAESNKVAARRQTRPLNALLQSGTAEEGWAASQAWHLALLRLRHIQ